MLKMTHHHEFCGSVECWLRREDRGPVASRSRSYIHLSLVFSQSLLFARSFSMLRCFCSSLIIRRSALITIVSSYVHWSHPACTHLLFFSSLVQLLIQDACCTHVLQSCVWDRGQSTIVLGLAVEASRILIKGLSRRAICSSAHRVRVRTSGSRLNTTYSYSSLRLDMIQGLMKMLMYLARMDCNMHCALYTQPRISITSAWVKAARTTSCT